MFRHKSEKGPVSPQYLERRERDVTKMKYFEIFSSKGHAIPGDLL